MAYFQLMQEEAFSLGTWPFKFLNLLQRKTSCPSHGSPPTSHTIVLFFNLLGNKLTELASLPSQM